VSGPCVICGAIDYSVSLDAPDICPACDCGDFGVERVRRLGHEITALRATLDRIVRVDGAIVDQLAWSINENSKLRARIAELEHERDATVPCRPSARGRRQTTA
jgi:hypothetical protein